MVNMGNSNFKIIHFGFILIPLACHHYMNDDPYDKKTWRVWYVFGIRVCWYNTTKVWQ